ncbi:MAG: GatB/YqeY domain-containing protein [Pseudomonadales bacterium]|nr:GatB/YqeY domain-containing protein [Pseudomonadales bacterium]
MPQSERQLQISEATKTAMKAREKERVAVLRMVNAELKRVEVDERRELVDEDVVSILKKMVKQRQDALSQFESAGRKDLADQEAFEIALIDEFLPSMMSDDELLALVERCISESEAAGTQDMGKVMGALKRSGGQFDMGKASGLVKAKLG